jgi:hypothetical protein
VGDYYNEELRKRQHDGDVGHAVLGNVNTGGAGRRWRALLGPLGVLAVGVLLVLVGPVPGLGMLLTMGAMIALPVVVIRALLSP